MRRLLVLAGLVPPVLLVAAVAMAAGGGNKTPDLTQFYPDIRTVVPAHLQLVNEHQKETLRFSNGIANTGGGDWALRPDPPPAEAQTTVTAVQEIRDSHAYYSCAETGDVEPCYNVLAESPRGTFEFHPEHNHWHIGDIALFEVRKGSPTGPVVGANSIKVTFCLIDWYKLDDNSPTTERAFFDCYASYQGISSGWVDQYHQSTEGQQLDLTGVPNADDYYLVSTANHAKVFLETNYDNNTEWVKFRLYQDSKGNRKIEVTAHSPCESPGMCGERSTNR
jgi:hypothetical protein